MRSARLTLEDFWNARRRKWLLPRLLDFLGPLPGTRILDVGGGTGASAAAYGRGAEEVVVLEPSEKKIAHGRHAQKGIVFVRGVAEDIPFPDARFDRVVCLAAFHHFQDQARGLREMRRVLAGGGRLVLFDLDPGTPVGRLNAFIENNVMGYGCTFSDPERTRRLGEEAGLSEVHVEVIGPIYAVAARKPAAGRDRGGSE